MPRAIDRPTPRLLSTVALAVAALSGCHGHGPGEARPGAPGLPTDIAALAAFDPASIAPGPPPKSGPARPLDVLDHGPQGRTEGHTELHVRFNQPVVPLDLRASDGLEKLFTIDPPLPGHAHWKTPDLLVFTPDVAPLDCHGYSVRFNGGVVGIDGQRFDRAITWTFETPRPIVLASYPESAPVPAPEDGESGDPELDDGSEGQVWRRDTAVLVQFDRPVALAQVQAHVRAAARPLGDREAAGVPVRVRVATRKEREQFYYADGDDRRTLYAVEPASLWPGGSEVTVSVTPGLRSEAGPLPLDTPWSTAFRTYSPQALVAINCPPADPCGLEPISLRLRNPIVARQLRKISVSPRPRHLIVTGVDDWGEGGNEVVIDGQFVPGTTYTVHVPADLRDIYGQSIPGGATRRAVIAPRATLALSAASGILAPGKPRTVGVESRHVRAIRVRAGVYTDAELQTTPLAPGSADGLAFPARVLERELKLSPTGKADWSSLALDLVDLTGGLQRPVLLEVSATELSDSARAYGLPDPVRGLFRLTDLGPLATISLPASSVQLLRLSTGAPVPGARVLRSDMKRAGELVELGVTDVAGMLALPRELVALPPAAEPGDAKIDARPVRLTFVDAAADDRAHLDLAPPPVRARSSGADEPSPLRPGERLIARIVSERGVYRPGETVRVVGWSAVDTPFSRSNLGRLGPGTAVGFELIDSFKKVVASHRTRTSGDGKFWAELQLPAEAALGRYVVHAKLAGGEFEVGVKVEDYRVPEYTVEARARRPDLLAGERTPIDVHASYYFGGPVQIKRVTRQTSCSMQLHRPPGLEDMWSVGEPIPRDQQRRADGPRVVEPEPTTPTPGRRALEEGSTLAERRYPQRCTVSVEVQDASLQGIGAETGFAVHPAAFYLGVAAPRGHLQAGGRVRVPLRAVGPGGERMAAAAVSLQVTRSWRERAYRAEGGEQVFDRWVDRSEPVKTCTLALPAAGADPSCDLPPLVEGTYELAASAKEPGSERTARTLTSFHVHPRVPRRDASWRSAPVERLEILTSHSVVSPGDTLEVAVRAPWPGAHGNLVLARGGVREALPVHLVDREALFKFTVDDTWTPEVDLHATLVTPPDPSSTYGKPYVHHASAVVRQGHEHRRLKVAVEAPGKAGPGERVPLRVRVRDEQDRPTAARVALWAVDEAVLDLTQYEVPDLLPGFLPDRRAETTRRDDYGRLLHPYVTQPEDPWFTKISLGSTGTFGHGSGAGFGARGSRTPSVRMGATAVTPARSRFATTPVFLADLAVGADGEASVHAELPDNLTTFRITAVASARLVDGGATGRFGKNDARTVVTAPLVLRAAMPRQLRPGDTAELAAIVQNNTGAAGRLRVTARVVDGTGPSGQVLKLGSSAGASAEVEDGGQARVVFQVQALAPGEPALELQASLAPTAGGEPRRDGLRLPLPIAAERTLTERVAAHGTITDDQAVAIPIKIPADVLPGHGGVTVDTSSTLLAGLEDAVHALVEYPYGCLEQTASRLLPLVALRQLSATYPLGVADPDAFMRAGVARILAMQAPGGGFGYWPGARDVHVYASAYATWVLHLASKAGYLVPADALARALDHLERRVGELDVARLPLDWGHDDGVRVAIALHVLAEAGRDAAAQTTALYPLRQRLPLFARAFLLMAMHRADPGAPEVRTLHAELLGNITELPATAHTSEAVLYGLDEFFASDGRSDAIALMALLRVQPDHPVVVKLARGLLERRIGGAWRNTQENAYALVALVDYARVYEAELPDFSARAWVGGANVLDLKFKGRELATRSSFTDMATIIGMSQKPGQAATPLLPVVLQRQGQGRLYYRLGAEWAPAQTDLPARAQGFTVARRLRTSDGAATDQVPAGEPIAMDITITSETRVRYVVLDVPLPAGLEGVSRTLGLGRRAATLGGQRGWWVSHEEQRPDRVVVFADDLPPGTHHHTIDLRSTSRGRFGFPPAVAEAMYMPEVYGRTVGATLEVR